MQRLRDSLYDALLEPADWVGALNALRTALEGDAFHHLTLRKDDRQVLSSLSNVEVPPAKLREYDEHMIHLDPRATLSLQIPLGEILLDHEHLSMSEIHRYPVYAEFLVPLGLRHTMDIPLQDHGHSREVLAILRPHDHRPFGPAQRLL
ncbi:MAG: hypothetical protein PHI55_10215, partial [Burkholderiaceae bacterium]|nr:hypothetical protein [Burkholderiaceae bacterium]